MLYLGQEKSNIFLFNRKHDKNTVTRAELKKKRKRKVRPDNDRLDSPFVIRVCSSYCLLLVKFSLQKTDTDKLNAATATDRAPQMTLVEKFAKQRPADN